MRLKDSIRWAISPSNRNGAQLLKYGMKNSAHSDEQLVGISSHPSSAQQPAALWWNSSRRFQHILSCPLLRHGITTSLIVFTNCVSSGTTAQASKLSTMFAMHGSAHRMSRSAPAGAAKSIHAALRAATSHVSVLVPEHWTIYGWTLAMKSSCPAVCEHTG